MLAGNGRVRSDGSSVKYGVTSSVGGGWRRDERAGIFRGRETGLPEKQSRTVRPTLACVRSGSINASDSGQLGEFLLQGPGVENVCGRLYPGLGFCQVGYENRNRGSGRG